VKTENLLAAESRISDVDVAREVAGLTRNQVIARSAMAAQAQAKTTSQIVTMLLG
ncbi:MAG TPA: flagellin, partial [Phycisphaerales bacterium]|nr:flagellin [Phycisphaerales bacterium]